VDIEAMRRQVVVRNFALRSHAMQHAVKERFGQDDVIHVALHGQVIETYPQHKRWLLWAEITIEGTKVPLHVVAEHLRPNAAVDFVTAYIPGENEWETPTRRRAK